MVLVKIRVQTLYSVYGDERVKTMEINANVRTPLIGTGQPSLKSVTYQSGEEY